MGAAALDPAPSAGVCRDGSDLVLQSFGRAIDVALICRSIRIPGRPSTSGRGSRTSSAGSRRSDMFPRSSAPFRQSSADLAVKAARICAAVPRSDSQYREIMTAAFWRLHVVPG